MPTPYEVLELAPGCTEAQIRRKYLDLVRQFPPDREPQKFAAIKEAYEALRDPETRISNMLFDSRCLDSIEELQRDLQEKSQSSTAKISIAAVIKLAESL